MSICCTGCIVFFIRFDTDKISFYDMYLSQSLLRVWRTEVNWKCSLCLKLPRDQSSCVKLEKFKKSNIRSNSWQWDGDFSWSVHLSVQGFGPENNILTTTGQISMRGGINNHVYREQFLIILLTPWPSVYCRHQVKISHWLKCSGSQQGYLWGKKIKGRSSRKFYMDTQRINRNLNVLVTSVVTNVFITLLNI